MRDRTRSKLDKLKIAVPPDEDNSDERRRDHAGVGTLLQRESTLSKIASGKKRTVQLLMHPTERIRIWSEHNRKYELLSVERCADLIEGFKRTGKQEFPAIVRRLEDTNQEFDYELICGARRKWTANHLGWDLLIEVRNLNDRQAFILQDLENRDREDISDYERALDYKQALPKYFENNRAQMAQFLEIDKSNFQKLIDLAEMPRQIIGAYGDLRDLKAHHGTTYKRLMRDQATKRRLLDKARDLKGQGANGREVFSRLKRTAASTKEIKAKNKAYGTLTVTPKANGAFQLAIAALSGDREEHIQALRKDFSTFIHDYLETES